MNIPCVLSVVELGLPIFCAIEIIVRVCLIISVYGHFKEDIAGILLYRFLGSGDPGSNQFRQFPPKKPACKAEVSTLSHTPGSLYMFEY
ncbi:hypothetical protein GDO86_010332 [Hymenochirus boettgeri]|uniref:Uncharacterized protein n=1 Tax=Hymenochirus boettgeri TaxID=247094 RepID=A0A8T2JMM8_9PIPI|nr:hypothetical protein GDO86_010332 [Hymenochirus boettgeri]